MPVCHAYGANLFHFTVEALNVDYRHLQLGAGT